MNGDCFVVALELAESVFAEARARELDAVVSIVHGTPIGRGDENQARRYWHGWVELAVGTNVTVLDYSNGQELGIGASTYYAIGGLDEHHVWRYPMPEARSTALTAGTYGPWVAGWEAMEVR
jgi:hypothetical protein